MTTTKPSSPAVQIRNLVKTFGRDQVLKGVNLTVPEGKVTVILGFSGAGKSVLMKHLLGLMRPTSGEISIFGQSINDFTEEQFKTLRRDFGMLFQHSALFDSMSVYDNVAFPLREHSLKSEREIEATVTELLGSVGLNEDRYWRLPSEISGGMQKRVALARAMALQPKIVLFDEPTTGLDPIMTKTVDHLILNETKKRKFTSIVISHDIFSTFRIADQIAFLHQGQVLMAGSPSEFRASDHPLIREFFDAVHTEVAL